MVRHVKQTHKTHWVNIIMKAKLICINIIFWIAQCYTENSFAIKYALQIHKTAH